MTDDSAMKALSDMASEAHTQIQNKHQHINPVVAVRRGMRDAGIPADAMTIDCLRTRRRIVLILHDDEADTLLYQFTTLEEEAGNAFQRIPMASVDSALLVRWMEEYFSDDSATHQTH
ncbi:hypothetical protein CF392_02300 [Tamilnaduibacter salinus]|uniref:Uncharacterized protein n=1 Tax=Tamilnaduibacter salinus TaxID=1484056 RepID=A0A2A2I7M2_9GAMM|nr:hypothetical protein [Tamilnaduibacter salinus]PAV27120.1 hypothetical protein CF392_02300 [Tamilnaduibacter salinus]